MNESIPPELLDLDLTSVDTSFPVIRSGLYELIVKDSDVVRNNADNGDLWVLKLSPTTDCQDTKGAPMKAAGVTIFHRVGLSTTEKYPPEAVAKNVARVIQSIKPVVTGITTRDLFDGSFKTKCKALQGRMLQAKVEALPEGKDKSSGKSLPPRNEISQLVKAS
jgi:hypothetical protein